MSKQSVFYSPVRIVSGVGESLKLGHWMDVYNAKKMLIITGGHVAKTEAFGNILMSLDEAGAAYKLFTECIPEPPMEIVDDLADKMRAGDIDMVAAVGGGSVLDTAKAVCMLKNNPGRIKEYLFGGGRTPQFPSVPLLCVPTTAGSGSEVSCASVIEDTDRHIKLSCTHPNLYPAAAILDPLMQAGMPQMVAAGTGMDALTHAIESFTSKNASAFSDMCARMAIKLIGANLPVVVSDPYNLESRMNMSQASSMAAMAMANGGLGAVHGISQAMGGVAHTPHGITNAILLPKVMGYNYIGNPEKFAEIAELLGADVSGMCVEEAAAKSVDVVCELNHRIGIPDYVDSLGVTSDMFGDIVEGTMGYRLLWMNPVEFTENMAYEILSECMLGERS